MHVVKKEERLVFHVQTFGMRNRDAREKSQESCFCSGRG